MMSSLLIPLLLYILWIIVHDSLIEHRETKLLLKYLDVDITERMMQKQPWIGETREQLIESMGEPAQIKSVGNAPEDCQIYYYSKVHRDQRHVAVNLRQGIVTAL